MPRLLWIWWLAILSASGEAVILEYRTEHACRIVQQAYARSGVTATVCQWKAPVDK